MHRRLFPLALIPLFALPLAAEPPRPGDDGAGIEIALTVVDRRPQQEPVRFELQAFALEQRPLELHSGSRVPIPTSLDDANGGGESFQYTDVGLAAWLEGTVLPAAGAGPRVRVRGKIELSALEQSPGAEPGAPPVIGTVTLRFDVVVDNGVETTVAEIPRPDGGSTTLLLQATGPG